MRRRLPPLKPLRAFEAAARHESFMLAAKELRVTPAAISHQIKSLEERLGVSLFHRGPRHVALTAGAVAFLPAVNEAFDLLERATDHLRTCDLGDGLRVAVDPVFAERWLTPRLGRFRDRHPGIGVRIEIWAEPLDSDCADCDLAIAIVSGAHAGWRVDPIAAVRLDPPSDAAPARSSYCLVCPEAWADSPRIQAFRRWVLEEAGDPPAA